MIVCNYVINLDRKTDRWESINNIINSTCLKDNNFIRFSAFDGFDYEASLIKYNLKDHPIIMNLKSNNIKVPAGVLGCLLSHVILLQKVIDDPEIKDSDYVGIYEDDFIIAGSINKFNENYNKFKNINLNELHINLLYLGGRFEPNFMYLNDEFFIDTEHENIFLRRSMDKNNKYYDRTTTSYIVKKSSCKKIINLICNNLLNQKINEIKAIDYILPRLADQIKIFDYFPHFFYSPVDAPSDIQGDNNKVLISVGDCI